MAITRGWVRREEHAGNLGRYHLLHDDRHRYVVLRYPHLLTVPDGSRRPEGRPGPANGVEQRRFAADIEERLLLTGEREPRQVLGSRRRAHGDRGFGFAQRGISLCDRSGDRLRHDAACEHLANGCRRALERSRIAAVDATQGLIDHRLHIVVGHEVAVRLCRDEKSRRDGKPTGGETHERRPFPANQAERSLLADEREGPWASTLHRHVRYRSR